ncbi:hypothetical protein [Natronococcus sp.]|uniref:hypothetical protein n=1 Tax=Natronococcus sp. TaxID=35747 RepID=UPI003A4E1602
MSGDATGTFETEANQTDSELLEDESNETDKNISEVNQEDDLEASDGDGHRLETNEKNNDFDSEIVEANGSEDTPVDSADVTVLGQYDLEMLVGFVGLLQDEQ